MSGWPGLPAEVVLIIASHLEPRDVLRASSVNRSLRSLLAGLAFRSITFSNDLRVSDSALAAVRVYGRYITELRFNARVRKEGDVMATWARPLAPAVAPGEEILPASTVELLQADRQLVPNLALVIVNLGEHWEEDMDEAHAYFFEIEDDSDAAVAADEASTPARKLLAETFCALSASQTTKHLKVEAWPPRKSSCFDSPQWRTFLARLESFDISLLKLYPIAGYNLNRLDGYMEPLFQIDQYFFEHLSSARRFTFRGVNRLFLGGGHEHGGFISPLPLPHLALPRVEHLELNNVLVGSELVEFLAAHRTLRLRSLTLSEAVSATRDVSDIASWAEFFTKLVKIGVKLEKFELATPARLPDERRYGSSQPYLLARLDMVKKELRRDPKRRLFGYATVDDKYGTWSQDEWANIESFEDGEDQKAYDAFMETVGSMMTTYE